MSLHPNEVLQAFGTLTGIVFRLVPNDIERQAKQFVDHGFTLRDLELVVLWTQKQIAGRVNGFSRASLQWRTIFGAFGSGEDFVRFQERLGLAEGEIRKGWRPVFTLGAEPKPTTKPAPAAAIDTEREKRLRDEARTGLGNLKQQILGYEP